MGNPMSKSSTAGAHSFNFLGLPPEVETMIAGHLCPNCSFQRGEIASPEEARELQCDLGNLARCSSYLLKIANGHRFHSFVQPCDPDFSDRLFGAYENGQDREVVTAHRFNNKSFPELLERLINYGQLRENLRFLALRNCSLRYKAGISKARLRLLISASQSLNLEVPDFVTTLHTLPNHSREDNPASWGEYCYWLEGELWLQDPLTEQICQKFDTWLVRLLFKLAPRLEKLMIDPEVAARVFALDTPAANLSSVLTLGIPEKIVYYLFRPEPPEIDMETLLLNFPNLWAFHSDKNNRGWQPPTGVLDDSPSPPSGPNVLRLALTSCQPECLEYVTHILGEFPRLEWFYFYRRPTQGWRLPDIDFSNSRVFDAVHHSLRVLKYTSSSVTWSPNLEGYRININSFEERLFNDVPHFGAFAVLERLEIDQALLGRMSTIRDYSDSPIRPHFPDLDWKLPQSLRRLTIRFVYDWPTLAEQLIRLAVAKRAGGKFPFLEEIYIVIVQTITVSFYGTWPPEIPLRPSYKPVVVSTGMLLREAGIKLCVSTEEIGPRPAELENYPDGLETTIAIVFGCHEFDGIW